MVKSACTMRCRRPVWLTYCSRGCVGRTKLGELELSQKHQTASPAAPPCFLAFCGLLSPCSLRTGSLTLLSLLIPLQCSCHRPLAVTCVLHCGLLVSGCVILPMDSVLSSQELCPMECAVLTQGWDSALLQGVKGLPSLLQQDGQD